jgi:hypothetical protein
MSRPTLEVADIIRTAGNSFGEQQQSHLAWGDPTRYDLPRPPAIARQPARAYLASQQAPVRRPSPYIRTLMRNQVDAESHFFAIRNFFWHRLTGATSVQFAIRASINLRTPRRCVS